MGSEAWSQSGGAPGRLELPAAPVPPAEMGTSLLSACSERRRVDMSTVPAALGAGAALPVPSRVSSPSVSSRSLSSALRINESRPGVDWRPSPSLLPPPLHLAPPPREGEDCAGDEPGRRPAVGLGTRALSRADEGLLRGRVKLAPISSTSITGCSVEGPRRASPARGAAAPAAALAGCDVRAPCSSERASRSCGA